MTITATQKNGIGPSECASGTYLDSGATPGAIVLNIGFTPRRVVVVNATALKRIEWLDGMSADHALQIANNDHTQLSVLTSGGITVNGGTVTLPAPAQNDQIYWYAEG